LVVRAIVITANIYNRVFFIKAKEYGTAFVIDHNSKQYLITAKHLINSTNQKSISFFLNDKWTEFPATLLGVGIGEVDVAVFRMEANFCNGYFPLPPHSDGMIIGQDVYFLGYPYKMWTDAGNAMKGRPCPFIKKGTLSSAFNSNDGVNRMYIDAINNEGFSGGPIVFKRPGDDSFQIAGIVSSFKIEFEKIISADGELTEMTVAYNTGFLIGYDISNAIKIIDKNPNGFPLMQ
jgi:S1-C subfamily serine protease